MHVIPRPGSLALQAPPGFARGRSGPSLADSASQKDMRDKQCPGVAAEWWGQLR